MSLVPKTRFTAHGYLRVVGGKSEERRLLLSPEEVANILDEDKAVPVGTEGSRIHRAIYSEPDDECFIVVQDRTNGEVITILPFSHHGRFVLDPAQVRKMAMKAVGKEMVPIVQYAQPLADVVAGSDAYCVVSMEVERPSSFAHRRSKTERLLRFTVPEGSLLHQVVENEEVRKDAEMEALIKLSWAYPDGSCVAVFKAHFVSGGTISEFRWFEKDWTPRLETI